MGFWKNLAEYGMFKGILEKDGTKFAMNAVLYDLEREKEEKQKQLEEELEEDYDEDELDEDELDFDELDDDFDEDDF